MKRQIYKLIFLKLMDWKIIGTVDERVKKSVMMVIPHTSWHDFYLGVFSRGILDVEINWVGKKELFRFPLGGYFRYMGGAPLDRKGGNDKVEAIAEIFKNKEVFRLAIAPEGTRKKVVQLKTGFYYIALKANVPIIPVAFDFGKKEVRYGDPFYPTGDIDKDLKILCFNFKDTKGKIPEYSFEVE
jgi:1-acyl-sn-glycerol-3-phosphate acyltransferase